MLGFGSVGEFSVGEYTPPGGSLFVQAINATANGAVSLVKRANKAIGLSGAGAASLIKRVEASRAIFGFGAVSATKSVGKFVSTAGAGVASIVTPVIRACIVLASTISAVLLARSVGKIVGVATNGAISIVRDITFTKSIMAVGTVSISALGLIVQFIRRALYLRGRTGSFWRGRR